MRNVPYRNRLDLLSHSLENIDFLIYKIRGNITLFLMCFDSSFRLVKKLMYFKGEEICMFKELLKYLTVVALARVAHYINFRIFK